VAALALGAPQTALAANISGAGATFPAPVYAKWAEAYKAQTHNDLNYQAIGSGGGIKQIIAGTVDFGASDKPLKPDVQAANGLQQFPTVIGGVVPVMNLPGFKPGQIHLTGKVLADIYLGLIKKWNDPVIASWNKGIALPNIPITVVHRSDGSGTSFLFTTYLSMEDPKWAAGPGGNDAVNWPVGLGGKGNDGVAAFVKQTVGSIGYVEYDQPGAASWPITGATFILMHKKQTNPQAGHDVLAFFDWAYKNGDAQAAALDYVTLPAPVKALVRKSWNTIVGPSGKPVSP
jgi:phosphate transport system substrate-binding protein